MFSLPKLLLLLCLLPQRWAFVRGTLVNRTIDDTLGDPTTGVSIKYTPSNQWNLGQDCQICLVHLDPSKPYLGTWHDVSWYPPNNGDNVLQAQTEFTGSAVYVYGMLKLDWISDCSFFIDGQHVGTYQRNPDKGAEGIQYNTLFYANNTLTHGSHQLTIQAGGMVTGNYTLLLLDYIIYTFDDSLPNNPSPSTTSTEPAQATQSNGQGSDQSVSVSKTSPAVIIVGTVCGILAAAILIALIILFCYRRARRSNPNPPQWRVTAFMDSAPPVATNQNIRRTRKPSIWQQDSFSSTASSSQADLQPNRSAAVPSANGSSEVVLSLATEVRQLREAIREDRIPPPYLHAEQV